MYFSLFFLDFHNNKSDLLLLPTDNILIFRLSNVATALNLATPILSVCLLKLGVSLFVQLFANIVIFKPNIQKLQLNLSFDISQSFDKAVCFLQKCFMINCFKINFRVEVSWWWVIYCISFSCFLSRKAAYSYKLCLHWSYIWSTFG